MYIYVIELVVIWLNNLLCFHSSFGRNRKKLFLFLTLTMMTLVLGLRSNNVGEDTEHYIHIFDCAASVSWGDIFSSRFKTVYYVFPDGFADKIENGFLILIKIIRWFTVNPQMYLLIIAGLTMSFMAKFIFDNSTDVFFSTYILLCECLYMFAFNGVRQMLALSIGVNAYTLLKRKKNCCAVAAILLAAYIHNSALLFFALCPIVLFGQKAGYRKYKMFKYVVGCAILIPLLLPIIERLTTIFLPRYTAYFAQNYWEAKVGGTAVLWLTEALLILFMHRQKFRYEETFEFASIIAMYLMLEMIGLKITAVSRLAIYFRAFLILFFPKALQSLSCSKFRKIIAYGIYALITLAFLSYAQTDARAYAMFLR